MALNDGALPTLRHYTAGKIAHGLGKLFKAHMSAPHNLLHYASLRAATPGSTLPSKSSIEAPPPVLQCVTFSIVLYFLQAVAVSPPPMTEMAPFSVAPTTASIRVFVPGSNLPISKTPIGPFQIMVFDASTAALFSSLDLGPQFKPMNPSGMPCSLVTSFTSPSSPNFDEIVK